ncbi:MAG: DoxX family protein [Propionibacteriaceae bacterium]|jgi:putative oxidoreductase|nr:DoxX family protein [Propionibacteriaceae bacterium]
MKVFVKVSQDIALLVVRLALAAVCFIHGWVRLATPGGIAVYVDRLAAAGLPIPAVFAWGAVFLELGGAVFLAFGLATRIVAGAFVVEFAMAIAWLHWHLGFFAADGGYEYLAVLAALALIFVAFGGGRLTVDKLLSGRPPERHRAGSGL